MSTLHFLDVGANVGQTFDDYITHRNELDCAIVWLFEPSPRNLPSLLAKAEAMSQRYRVRVCPFGLHGANRLLQFHQKADDCRGDSFEHDLTSDHYAPNLVTGYSMLAAVIGIVEFIELYVPKGDRAVIKLDCEGAEYDILEALCKRLPRDPRIAEVLVEWHTIGSAHLSIDELNRLWSETQTAPINLWRF